MRLFVAACPSSDVRAAVRTLAHSDSPGVRWTPEESWHVTLRFLGEVADPDPVIETLRAELGGRGARTATLDGVTSRLGSALVVRVDGLRSLATLVRLATSHLGDPPRPDPFEGHLTVARGGRRGLPDDVVGLALGAGAATWSVDHVALVASAAGRPTGPATTAYETLATIPLT